MKVLSAKALPNVAPMTRKKRLAQIERHKKMYGQMKTGQSEFANYDITDIATDEEAKERKCDCIIHSGGHKPFVKENWMSYWADWGDK
jgi:hypothetical protein